MKNNIKDNMKFKFEILAFAALLVSSCNPLDDTYAALDKDNDPNAEIVKTCEEYVLTAADYETISKAASSSAAGDATILEAAAAVKSECALNSVVDKINYVPSIVAKMFPSWQNGSVVNVTYNYSNGLTEGEKECAGIEIVSITDYASENNYYDPSHTPEDNIPAYLAARYPGYTEGAKMAVEYKYSDVDPNAGETGGNGGGNEGEDDNQGGTSTKISEGFDGQTPEEAITIDGWKNIFTTSDRNWIGKEHSENLYAQMSAYNSAGEDMDVDAWLITPKFAVEAGMYLSFDLKFGYPNGGEILDVMVSTSYDGGDAIDASQWTSIKGLFTYPALPETGYNDAFANVGQGILGDYVGKEIYVAFHYAGNSKTASTTVQIDNVVVDIAAPKSAAAAAPKACNALYEFDGTKWAVSDCGAYLVAPADYDAMGDPGKYDNFSSSAPASSYLPIFFAAKYPYAMEGDTQVAIYKEYKSATPLVVDEYIFEGGKWVVNANIEVVEKDIFIKSAGNWMFDPVMMYTMITEDYEAIVAWTLENKPAYMDPKYTTNSEWWFGVSSFYGNYNIQLVKRRSYDPEGILTDMSDAEATAYCWDQVFLSIKDFVLAAKYADAPLKDAAGNDQIIKVDCVVYDGESVTYTVAFKVLGGGDFEYVSHERK